MNTSIKTLVLSILVLILAACGNSDRAQLKASIEKTNKQLPLALGNGTIFQSMDFDDDNNVAVMTYLLDEDTYNLSSIAGAETAQRRFLSNYLQSETAREFTELLTSSKAGIKLVFIGQQSNDSHSFILSDKEVADILAEEIGSDNIREQLEAMVEISNAQCPQKIAGDALVLRSVTLDDDAMCFNYDYNPDVINFTEDTKEELLQEFKTELTNDLKQPGSKMQKEYLQQLGMAVKYRFKQFEQPDSTSIVFEIPASEIAKI